MISKLASKSLPEAQSLNTKGIQPAMFIAVIVDARAPLPRPLTKNATMLGIIPKNNNMDVGKNIKAIVMANTIIILALKPSLFDFPFFFFSLLFFAISLLLKKFYSPIKTI